MSEEKQYRLEIDPNILKLLGPNLYTNIYYVLAELIANAYDASAKNVYIINNNDAIIVEDDGKGMSYSNGDIRHYLDVAKETRVSERDSLTDDKPPRRKMGRKGVGKLAALSVSENVNIMTKAFGEVSGFIMSRTVPSSKMLQSISENEIVFHRIQNIEHGTSIVMLNPEYKLHKTHVAIRRNLLKIFPMVNEDFQIHIITDDEETIINSFEEEMIRELGTLELIGEDFYWLEDFYNNPFPEVKESSELFIKTPTITENITLTNKYGVEKSYNFELKGWIGTYKSTMGRKLGDKTDFPDNFISIFSNNKLGEFNILPIIGKNRMTEVFIVGQLHIDLFEETELPDMALSNRQGYKTEDKRYQLMLKFADKLLARALSLRSKYTDIKNGKKNLIALDKQKEKDKKLEQTVNKYKQNFKDSLTKHIKKSMNSNISDNVIQEIANETNEETLNLLGIKNEADSQRKKILLSQTEGDKPFSDVIYSMLLYNNIPKATIIYSNSSEIESRLPLRVDIYDYLRSLFIDTYSKDKLYIIYVTSNNMDASWGCHMEAGAGWIVKNEYAIFNSNNYQPKKPLDNGTVWQASNVSEDGRVSMDKGNAQIFIENITYICNYLGYSPRSRGDNYNYLSRLTDIIADNNHQDVS